MFKPTSLHVLLYVVSACYPLLWLHWYLHCGVQPPIHSVPTQKWVVIKCNPSSARTYQCLNTLLISQAFWIHPTQWERISSDAQPDKAGRPFLINTALFLCNWVLHCTPPHENQMGKELQINRWKSLCLKSKLEGIEQTAGYERDLSDGALETAAAEVWWSLWRAS